MRLQRIEILGFKSFADKTVLDFTDGITAIVGPNGCGKSNISDAFRWVLGEQSARSMRGGKMHDVIFAGTSKRPPLNFAEVSITLSDIEEGELPLPYQEITITRRLHRNGDSDYFINRQPARLKDIQGLILDSGMGKDAYSIFEQGKIDQVIQYSPEERRFIFEEAAGILRFLQRKRESMRKLEQVDQNMVRVKDIHQEVEQQIVVLEKQAVKAKEYKENKASLDLLEKALLVYKTENFQRRLIEITQKESEQKQQLTQASEKLKEVTEKLHQAKESLKASEQTFFKKNEELFRVRGEKEMKLQETENLQERFNESSSKEKKWHHELEELAKKKKKVETERSSLNNEHNESDKSVQKSFRELEKQREINHKLEENVNKLRMQVQVLQQENLRNIQLENQIDIQLKQGLVRQESTQERLLQLQTRKSKFSQTKQELKNQIADKAAEQHQLNKSIDEQKSVFAKTESRLQEISHDISTARSALDTTLHEITEGKARHKLLLKLREECEGFSAGSKKLLQESANAKSPLYNLLKGVYEVITPESGAEIAVASAMRPYAQTLIVETKAHLKLVLEYAHKNQFRDFSIICLELLKKHKPKKSPLQSLLESIITNPIADHFLSQVYISDTVEAALKHIQEGSEHAFWCKDGNYLDANHVMFSVTQSDNNIFMREAECKTLAKKLEAIEIKRQKLDAALKGLYLQREELQSEKLALDKSIRRDEMKLVEINFSVQKLHADLEKILNEEKQVDSEAKTLSDALQEIAVKLNELTQRHVMAQNKSKEIQEQQVTSHSQLDHESKLLKQEREKLVECESCYRKTLDQQNKLKHALEILQIQDEESVNQADRLNSELKQNSELQKQLIKKENEVKKTVEVLSQQLQGVTEDCKVHEKDVAARKQTIEEIDADIQKKRLKVTQIEEEIYKYSVQITQIQNSIQALVEELQDKHHQTHDEARLTVKDVKFSLDQIEKKVRALRSEVENSGDINLTSIEEFDKNKTRHEFLSQQLGDLNESKQELIKIIAQLDGESRKIFLDTFEVIVTNFRKNFKILFNGGEADLKFTENEDVLEAGIEIIAKPPGKQMRSISLLSGGEKCLTAMALLFSIFEVKPSPFCILDEIDAPLDESNVQRFVEMVKQFTDRCQFIMITHNKRTMSIADVLCGVSMEEKGVSKLVTLEFKGAKNTQFAIASK